MSMSGRLTSHDLPDSNVLYVIPMANGQLAPRLSREPRPDALPGQPQTVCANDARSRTKSKTASRYRGREALCGGSRAPQIREIDAGTRGLGLRSCCHRGCNWQQEEIGR